MRLIRKILLLLVICLIVTGCVNKKDNSDGLKFKNEYEDINGRETDYGKHISLEISEDNIIKYSNFSEILDLLEDGTGVIYFGFPECPWCRNAVPVLLDAASSTNLEKIYYVNVYDLRDTLELNENDEVVTKKKASEEYYELLEKLDNILLKYELTGSDGNIYDTGEKRLYVPLVLFVKDGEVVAYHNDTVESQNDPFILLDDNQYNELYNIYLDGIHKVLDDICDEECEDEK